MAVVLKPKRGTNTPGTDDIVSGEIAIDTSAKKLYINDGGTVKEIGGGGAGGSTTDVTQSSHGFSAKDCIRHNGSSWVKAQANAATTLALGVVTAVADSNTFTVAQSGRFTISSHGLTVGQWYYLDASTAGALTATEPSISQPLVYVESASVVFVFPYRPTQLLVNGGASVVPGDNTVTSAKIVDGTIVTADLADDAITTAKIADDAITSALIADDAVVQAAIADDAVNEARLQVSNSPTNGYFLSAQSGNTGGLTWAEVVTGTAWDMTVKTANFTATSGSGYLLNTTSGTFTITLPASPSNGDIIEVKDVSGTADTNAILINPNSLKIDGSTLSKKLHDERGSVALLYTGTTYGWVTVGDTNNTTNPLDDAVYNVEFLTLAGGGAGGKGWGGGGGGGAGGYIASTTVSLAMGTQYTVTVGAGGAGSTSSGSYGANGGNSSFAGTTATGGGAGGNGGDTAAYIGADGGSGGGGTASNDQGEGTSGQGNDGGLSAGVNGGNFNRGGGGGGGAGAAGSNSSGSYNGGAGGAGSSSSITGSSVARAGGGGGSIYGYFGNAVASGGSGGGGNGGSNNTLATAGSANTGGGGGASCYRYNPYVSTNTGGTGGSGIVILKVPTANYSGTTTGSPTVTTSGDYKILQFTSSGSYTA